VVRPTVRLEGGGLVVSSKIGTMVGPIVGLFFGASVEVELVGLALGVGIGAFVGGAEVVTHLTQNSLSGNRKQI